MLACDLAKDATLDGISRRDLNPTNSVSKFCGIFKIFPLNHPNLEITESGI
jgi:hypothetical protein